MYVARRATLTAARRAMDVEAGLQLFSRMN